MSSDYFVTPSEYRKKFRYGLPDIPLYCKYTVTWADGHSRLYSIERLEDGSYALVDFDDYMQPDKHYSTFERARFGMLCKIRRVSKQRMVCHA